MHNVKLKDNSQECVDEVLRNDKPTAYVAKRVGLELVQLKYGEDVVYLSPFLTESSISMDLVSIPYSSQFKYAKEFNDA